MHFKGVFQCLNAIKIHFVTHYFLKLVSYKEVIQVQNDKLVWSELLLQDLFELSCLEFCYTMINITNISYLID